MRIVYLHQYFNTPTMAGSTRSYEMARRLVAMGHEVDLITSARDRDAGDWRVSNEAGIRVHWLPIAYANTMGFTARLRAFARFAVAASRRAASLEADVVFATSTPLTIVLPGLYASRTRRIPLVFEVRDLWPEVPIAMGVLRSPILIALARWLERLAYRSARHVVTLAPGMRDDIVATGVPTEKVTVIPNGCDREIFGANQYEPAKALRTRYQWLQHRRMLLFGGALGRANGVGYLVAVARAMREIDPEIRFVVIGDGAESEKIAESARDAGILDQSFFMLGALPKMELATWLAASDMALGLFSGPRVLWKDAVQNKFFDALAAGKPIACNFRGFQSEVAEQHDVGLIFDAKDPRAAARQIHAKLVDEAWLRSARDRAWSLAGSDFDRDRLAAQLNDVLQRAVT